MQLPCFATLAGPGSRTGGCCELAKLRGWSFIDSRAPV